MLKVYICEDNTKQLEMLKTFVANSIMIHEYDMELGICTSEPDNLLQAISDNKCTGVYFLDIDLKRQINGLQLASKIRDIDPRGFIIFVTSHAEMSFMALKYQVEAMDFIIKDSYSNIKNEISDCLLNVNKRHNNQHEANNLFIIKSKDKIISEPYDTILFFIISNVAHKVVMHSLDT